MFARLQDTLGATSIKYKKKKKNQTSIIFNKIGCKKITKFYYRTNEKLTYFYDSNKYHF